MSHLANLLACARCLALLVSLVSLTKSEWTFLEYWGMDDDTVNAFLSEFCDDPGDLYWKFNGNETLFSTTSGNLTKEDNSSLSKTYRCQVDSSLIAVKCNVISVDNTTFGNVTNCSIQELNSSCSHQCIYVWTSLLDRNSFFLDVGQCQRSEERFVDYCRTSEENTSVPNSDSDDSTTGDPMKILAYCIIFLQASIISVFMGFILYIDIF
uniref:Ig-like domain-containing protein n=1 Tax=Biomphalaria glabrata TaxID=6526 RepID=A0A2C9KI72_BIOGL